MNNDKKRTKEKALPDQPNVQLCPSISEHVLSLPQCSVRRLQVEAF